MRTSAIPFLAAACLIPLSAVASRYQDAQVSALEAAAKAEADEHDPVAAADFQRLADAARQGGPVGLSDLPADWRDNVRNGRRDTNEAEDRVRLHRLELKLADISSGLRDAFADKIAHAEVDTFRARHELSEPRTWHTCAYDVLRHAEQDLAGIDLSDRDQDGIPDALDRCPDDPEDKDNFEDADGCADRDNDRDGIPDVSDKCPNQAEDKDGFQDADGCPDPDNDQDGVLDVNDKCPDIAETVNGMADADGCPDDLHPVYFPTNGSRLDADAIEVLGHDADVLKTAPQMRVRIEGHTDSQGSAAANRQLGQRRANAVRNYLVNVLGLDSGRFDTATHGEEMPAADNSTSAGRALNRRVETVVIEVR